MRIALVVHAFPPDSVAGVEVCALRHATALLELGHEVRVVTAVRDLRAPTASTRNRRHGDLEVAEIVNNHDGVAGLSQSYCAPRVEAAALDVLRAFDPAVVHFHHLLNLSAGLLPAVAALGTPTIATLHDYWLTCGRDGARQRDDLSLCEAFEPETCARCLSRSAHVPAPAERHAIRAASALGLGGVLQATHRRFPRLGAAVLATLRAPAREPVAAADVEQRNARLRDAFSMADVLVAPTRFAKTKAIEAGLARVHVVPNGAVDFEPRPFAARPRTTFGFVGTLAPHKGVHVLLEAFRGLSQPGLRLLIFGSGRTAPGYAADLARRAQGDPRVRLAGHFAPEHGERVFAQIDVLVLPSLWWENAPLVVQEALARGVPVIASELGGVPELVSSPWGRLVRPGDVGALRGALDAALAGRDFGAPLPPAPIWTSVRMARACLELLETSASLTS